jgi:hypothetical protein
VRFFGVQVNSPAMPSSSAAVAEFHTLRNAALAHSDAVITSQAGSWMMVSFPHIS